MATTTEEILMRVGMDQTGVEAGTRRMLDTQKKAAGDYVAFWKKATDEKEAYETKQAIDGAARRNEARRLWRQRELEQEKRHIRDMAEVEKGYMPDSWKRQAAVNSQIRDRYGIGMAAENLGRDIISMREKREAKEVIKGVGESIEGGASNVAGRVLGLVIEKKLQKLMTGYVAKFLKGVGAAIGGLSAIPVIGAAVLAGRYLTGQRGDLNEMAGAFGTIEGTHGTEEDIGKRLQKMIASLSSSGHISKERAEILSQALEHGGMSGISAVQRELKNAQRLYDIQKEAQDERAKTDKEHHEFEKKSLEYAQKQRAQQREFNNLRKQETVVLHEIATLDQGKVTIEQLAGRGYMKKLGAYFGEGGAMDLESGGGKFAEAAQNALYFKNKQLYDIMQGNAQFNDKGELTGGLALVDRSQQIRYENQLRQAGIETPEMMQKGMAEKLRDTRDAMQEFLILARTQGILINTGEK